MKTPIIKTYVEPAILQMGYSFIVETHVKKQGRFFHVKKQTKFPTQADAQTYQKSEILAGARWIRTDMVPTQEFKNLPEVKAWKSASGGLNVSIDGRTIASNIADRFALKGAIQSHPKAKHLTTLPCRRCATLPRVNLTTNTLHHECDAHSIFMDDPLIPITLKIATWNTHFANRRSKLKLQPVTTPHLISLGMVREPSNRDMVRRIRKIEIL